MARLATSPETVPPPRRMVSQQRRLLQQIRLLLQQSKQPQPPQLWPNKPASSPFPFSYVGFLRCLYYYFSCNTSSLVLNSQARVTSAPLLDSRVFRPHRHWTFLNDQLFKSLHETCWGQESPATLCIATTYWRLTVVLSEHTCFSCRKGSMKIFARYRRSGENKE